MDRRFQALEGRFDEIADGLDALEIGTTREGMKTGGGPRKDVAQR